jgi:hypothetical protein
MKRKAALFVFLMMLSVISGFGQATVQAIQRVDHWPQERLGVAKTAFGLHLLLRLTCRFTWATSLALLSYDLTGEFCTRGMVLGITQEC